MEKIRIGEKEFAVEIKRKTMQSLRLRIREKNKIEVGAPWLMPMMAIKIFLNSNSEWIIKNSQKIKRKKDLSKLKKIEILGEDYEVEMKKSLRDSLVIIDKKILVNFSEKKKIKEIIDKKMRNLAKSLIKDKTQKLAKKYDLNYGNVGIKNQSSRFGSCSHNGNLNFNWQIILFPTDKFEHVILHELTHLTVKNHSAVFWKQLTEYDENWRENNRWLRKEGTKKFIV